MNLKSYIAPIALAVFTAIIGFYLLLGSSPANTRSHSEGGALDAEVLRYFSAKADQYAKEDAEANSGKSAKKAGQI
ncbi:hypothetical protein DCO17_03280 [Polynucleobacter tropicus]|uniref:Uncharacterized protein n=1 Tax=Polynucleobacter tropicus TaxID=1743174 RepID=A0A6M9PPP9_9BURK|nr:hypothetical protein [Polynucleobacter tropicus]QKM64344.1 hypothetical protein DCO17_03280 [Polynucleobacter tropicus]